MINAKSPAFKARGLEMYAITKKMAIDLICEEPNLLKRPLVLHGRKALFGFNAEAWDEEFTR